MKNVLRRLGIRADIEKVVENSYYVQYYLKLSPGTRVSYIEKRATEIGLSMKSYGKPLVKVISEQGLVVLEMLIKPCQYVSYNELRGELFQSSFTLPIMIGRGLSGEALLTDLASYPHLLVAGCSGSGKSIYLSTLVCGLVEARQDVKLVLVDPKAVEFVGFNGVKSLMYDVVTDADDVMDVLDELVGEMELRFRVMATGRSNTIEGFNQQSNHKLPYIVVVIDEFSDLSLSIRDFQSLIGRLSAKSRAAGIHFVLATQRPVARAISGLVKANFSARIGFHMSSAMDSRILFDRNGAEGLRGCGDGLLVDLHHDLFRFQAPLITREQVAAICESNKRTGWNKLVNALRGL